MSRLHLGLLTFACSVLLTAAGEVPKQPTGAGKPASAAEIDRLIQQMGNDDFFEREAASKALEGIGEQAQEALYQAATQSDDPEIRKRAENVLKTVKLFTDARLRGELGCFTGHTEFVAAAAVSPDGKRVLSGSRDGTVRLWDVRTKRELRCFKRDQFTVGTVAFSPDGKRALSGSRDSVMRLWDLGTGKEAHTFTNHTGWVCSVAFSPDGKRGLSGSTDKTVRLWDLKAGKELRRLHRPRQLGLQRGLQFRWQAGPLRQCR